MILRTLSSDRLPTGARPNASETATGGGFIATGLGATLRPNSMKSLAAFDRADTVSRN